MDIYQLILQTRLKLGWTQANLAKAARVSIPTIQNIEAKKANLSLELLTKILNTLDLKLEVSTMPVNWDRLCDYGLALLKMNTDKTFAKPRSKQELTLLTLNACDEVLNNSHNPSYERKKIALQSFLLALKNHYPTFFASFRKSSAIIKILPPKLEKSLDGRHIKAYRHSKSIISEYL